MTTATVTNIPTAKPKPAKVASRGRTKLERAQAAAAIEKLEREARESAHAAPRLSARHKGVLYVLLGLAAFMAAASFVTSFSGLYGAAEWAIGGGQPWLQVAVPCMFDVAILAFTLKLFIDREDGDKVRWTWMWIAALALVSSATNVVHTLQVSTASSFEQLIVGCFISGSAPFLLALVVDVAASKVFRKPGVTTSD